MISLRLGDTIYLNLQLWDGISSMPKRVFATLRGSNGAVIGSDVELIHVGGGEFRDTSLTYPADEFLTVNYLVYETDGTTVDTNYAISKENYMRNFDGEIISTNLDAKITSIGGTNGGTLASIQLEAELMSEELLEMAVPEVEDLEATLLDTEILVGTIEEEVTI